MTEAQPPPQRRRVATGHSSAYRTPSVHETTTVGARVDGELRCLEHYVTGADGRSLTVGEVRDLIRGGHLQWVTSATSLSGETTCTVCGADLREGR